MCASEIEVSPRLSLVPSDPLMMAKAWVKNKRSITAMVTSGMMIGR